MFEISPICRRLVGARCADAYILQVQRVLRHVLADEEVAAFSEPGHIVAAFRSAKLIPPDLIEICGRYATRLAAESSSAVSLAVCFAACIYPRRAFQLGAEDLVDRVEAFAAVYWALASSASLPSPQPERLISCLATRLKEIAAADVGESLSDLSAAENVPEKDEAVEKELRKTGAALYLTSCPSHIVDITFARWRDDAGFVRYLRTFMPSPPSYFVNRRERAQGAPDWQVVRVNLTRLLPDQPREYIDRAIMLEQAAWNEASRWIEFTLVTERVGDFWEQHWDKLNSGFPYYAFLSRFPYWWKQCLARFRFSTGTDSLDAEESEEPVERVRPASELSLEALRCCREGYRLLRTTFFVRPDHSTGDHLDPAQRNDRLRLVVDQLWYKRLAGQIEGDIPSEMVNSILARFDKQVTKDTINNLNHRLHRRFWAYQLARVERWRNSQICSARHPNSSNERKAIQYPLLGESGVLTIASIARLATPGASLLWAFTAHVFFHPLVEPQRQDPWTFKRYLRELWYWIMDPTFDDAIISSTKSSLAAAAFLAALQKPVLRDLVAELRSTDEQDLDIFLSERDFRVEETAAMQCVEQAAGMGIGIWSEKTLRHWRKLVANHWIVPIWYLVFVEKVDPANMPSRLQVDTNETQAVLEVAKSMLETANSLSVAVSHSGATRSGVRKSL